MSKMLRHIPLEMSYRSGSTKKWGKVQNEFLHAATESVAAERNYSGFCSYINMHYWHVVCQKLRFLVCANFCKRHVNRTCSTTDMKMCPTLLRSASTFRYYYSNSLTLLIKERCTQKETQHFIVIQSFFQHSPVGRHQVTSSTPCLPSLHD